MEAIECILIVVIIMLLFWSSKESFATKLPNCSGGNIQPDKKGVYNTKWTCQVIEEPRVMTKNGFRMKTIQCNPDNTRNCANVGGILHKGVCYTAQTGNCTAAPGNGKLMKAVNKTTVSNGIATKCQTPAYCQYTHAIY